MSPREILEASRRVDDDNFVNFLGMSPREISEASSRSAEDPKCLPEKFRKPRAGPTRIFRDVWIGNVSARFLYGS